MGINNEVKTPVLATVPEALPKARVKTSTAPTPIPLPLPEPRVKKYAQPESQQEPVDDGIPIRSRSYWIGSKQIKLACAALIVVLIGVGVVAFFVTRIKPAEQAKKVEAFNDTIQPKPTSSDNPVVFPPIKPTSPKKPTDVTKPEISQKKPTVPKDEPLRAPEPNVPVPPGGVAVTPNVATLIRQLTDTDETVRLKAAKELGRMKAKAKDAIPALKTATSDQDEDVREVAKKSLAAVQAALGDKPNPIKPDLIKPDPAKVDARLVQLMKDLRSKDNKVRLAAIAKLEELGEAAKPAGADLVEFGMMAINPAVKDAANAAMEKIDPTIHKAVITLLYDKDERNKLSTLETLATLGSEGRSALPAIKAYHDNLFRGNRSEYAPASTTIAMVRIAPDDVFVQREVLKLVGSTDNMIQLFSFGSVRYTGRDAIIKLMHELKIEDQSKTAPLLSGFIASEDPILISEIGKLNIESKNKLAALGAALSNNPKRITTTILIISEVAKLGADAKAALPTLKSLKTHPDVTVREAAANAVEKIKD